MWTPHSATCFYPSNSTFIVKTLILTVTSCGLLAEISMSILTFLPSTPSYPVTLSRNLSAFTPISTRHILSFFSMPSSVPKTPCMSLIRPLWKQVA